MKKWIWNSFILLLYFTQSSCDKEQEDYDSVYLASSWADLSTYITQFTPANSPTFASRCFGYIGLTMYESIVHGYDSHQSLAGQLNGLPSLPLPDTSLNYSWEIALNAGQAYILDSIYMQTSDENKAKIDSLEKVFLRYYSSKVRDREIVNRSMAFGQAVADAIFQWSKTDGGHRGYLRNFDKDLVHPERPGSWKPPLYAQSFSHHPLHPHWGKNRTFLK